MRAARSSGGHSRPSPAPLSAQPQRAAGPSRKRNGQPVRWRRTPYLVVGMNSETLPLNARRSVSRVLSHRPSRPGDGDGHSSGTPVTGRLARPTRAAARKPARHGLAAVPAAPTWSCSRWGFPCRRHYWKRGALLPHHFTLAAQGFPNRDPLSLAVCFLWHCPWGRPRRPLTGTVLFVEPGLSSPSVAEKSGHPTVWHGIVWADRVRLSKALVSPQRRCARPSRQTGAPPPKSRRAGRPG